MNFLTMEYFAMTAKEKSFTKAADKLHITQQTLSAAISNLEKEVGNQLFVRHVPLELTYAGEVFLKYSESFLANHTGLMREMKDIAHNEKGILKVGIGNTRGRALMPEIIAAFQQKYANYSIEITEGSNLALQKSLSQGEIDVAIAVFGEIFPALDLFPGYQERTVLIISREQFHELFGSRLEEIRSELLQGHLQSVQSCPFVLGRTADMTGKVANFFLSSSGVTPTVRALSDNIETLISLCLKQVGACFCPDNLLYATLSQEQLDRLYIFSLPEGASYDVRFGKRSGNDWQIVKDFIEISQKTIRSREAETAFLTKLV